MKTTVILLAGIIGLVSCKPQPKAAGSAGMSADAPSAVTTVVEVPAEDSKPASDQKVSQETAEEQVLIEKTLVSMMQRNVDNLRSDLERTKDAGPAALKAEDLRRKMDELEARKAKLAKWEAALDAAGE